MNERTPCVTNNNLSHVVSICQLKRTKLKVVQLKLMMELMRKMELMKKVLMMNKSS